MYEYAIFETDEGLTVVKIGPDEDAEDVAAERGSYVVDPGPYASYEEAYDAMLAIQAEEENDE
jgi:hypothetical protein